MRSKGKLSRWNDSKGFGFITPMTGGERVFVHISAFNNRDKRPTVNEIITYTPSQDKRGRACAVDAIRAGDRLAAGSPRRGQGSIVFVVLSLSVLLITAILGRIPMEIVAGYLVLSVVAFSAYALDKSAAKSGRWRTREKTLHLLALAGGWPGALIAQQILRHKSSKRDFRLVFWVTVVLNCALFLWLLTPEGSRYLQTLIG